MNVNVMVNACVLVNSATFCFAPFIFAIPMPGQKLENKPNFSLQYTVPLFFTTTAKPPTATTRPARFSKPSRRNSLVPNAADDNLWVKLDGRIKMMQQNAKVNAARFRAAVNKYLPGRPVYTMDAVDQPDAMKKKQNKKHAHVNLPSYML